MLSGVQDVLAQLVAYFSGRRGAEASSEAVVGEFCDAAQSLGGELFRRTLKQAATLDKRRVCGLFVRSSSDACCEMRNRDVTLGGD